MSSTLPVERAPIYRFDKFELLPETEELRKNGTRIHLPPQPFRVLLLLVQRAGEIVTREEIQEALWGAEVFVDFEQGINTAIRRIRFALNDHAETPRFLQTLPRRGYCFVAPVERVVPAMPATPSMFVSPPVDLRAVTPWPPEVWAPPEISAPPAAGGLKPAAPQAPANGFVPVERRALARRIVAVAFALLLVFATRGPQVAVAVKAPPKPALRVTFGPIQVDRTRPLPLDPRRVADEMHTQLGRLQPQRIQVVEAGAPADLRIDSSLQDAGDLVRFQGRITELRTGRQIWSETVNRDAADTGDFPLEIALRVAMGVSERYIPPGRTEPIVRTPVSAEALALYREARALLAQPLPQRDMDGALVKLQKAVELEPRFAEAWSGIGDVWCDRATAWTGESRVVALTQARIALERAIDLDPECAEALNDYGRVLMQHGRRYAAAETLLRRAIAADPEYVHAHFNLATLLSAMGEHDEALAAFRRVQLLDPNQYVPSTNLAFFYFMSDRNDDALTEYRAALRILRNGFQAHWGIMWSSMASRRWDVAGRSLAAILEEPVDLGPNADSGARYREQFRRLEPILLARERGRRLDPYVLACFYASTHETEKAFAALDRAIEGNSILAIFTYVDPRLDYIRTDPRFEERLERLGFRR